MTTELTKYEKAKRALAEAKNVDEVRVIRNKAIAMRIYAAQAQDRTLEGDAIDIRIRAERCLGQMMAEQPKAKPPNPKPPNDRRVAKKPDDKTITLLEAGIDKNLAHSARKLARMTDEEAEMVILKARKYCTTDTDRERKRQIDNGILNSYIWENLIEHYGLLQGMKAKDVDQKVYKILTQIDVQVKRLLSSTSNQEENVVCLNMTRK